MRLLVLARKKPVERTSSSTWSGFAAARDSASGYAAKSAGVTMFTRASVLWADRMVAASNWKGSLKSNAQSSTAVPGYTSARRSAVRRARPFAVLGCATGSRYRVTLAGVDAPDALAVLHLRELSAPDYASLNALLER